MTPSLKELALAAVEARKNYDKTDHSLNNEFFEWQKVKELFSIYATPERILEYRDEVLEEAAKWHDDLAARLETESEQYSKSHPQTFSMIMVNMHKSSAEAIRSLKSREPSP